MVLFVSVSSRSPPTPGTALSPEVLKDFQSSKMAVQAAPSVCRDILVGSFPSEPVPESRPAAFRASANPVFFRASDSLELERDVRRDEIRGSQPYGVKIFSCFSASSLVPAPPHFLSGLHWSTMSTTASSAFLHWPKPENNRTIFSAPPAQISYFACTSSSRSSRHRSSLRCCSSYKFPG